MTNNPWHDVTYVGSDMPAWNAADVEPPVCDTLDDAWMVKSDTIHRDHDVIVDFGEYGGDDCLWCNECDITVAYIVPGD